MKVPHVEISLRRARENPLRAGYVGSKVNHTSAVSVLDHDAGEDGKVRSDGGSH